MKNLRRITASFFAAVMLFTTIGTTTGATEAFAAVNYGTATVRVLATTDMHGQSVRLNYDSGVEGEGSLAQIAGIVKRVRKNMKHGTTVTVDCGDNVYGIGAESLMQGADSGAQYMYEEMKALNYDAITLGNHDFDYGVDYIKQALSDSDMSSKVVLSNVVDAKTKKNLYKGSTLITKTVKTTTGKSKKIKIGFVGAVVPSLTLKTDGMDTGSTDTGASQVSSLVTRVSWQGVIETKDIVESVTAQAKALKKKGANLVIAIVHSGIGSEDYEYMDDNAGYALTAVPEIDAVCAGHTHMDFPAETSKARQYMNYANCDGDGLMNGKPLIEEKDHGASLGIADLKIGFSKWGTPYVKSSSARIRTVKASDPEDSEIVSINQKYDEKYKQIYDRAVTATNRETDNYFGMIEDNPLIHLCNAAKIEYGLRAADSISSKYSSAPVIAATSYQMAGQDNSSNYIKVDGTVHVKDLLNLEAFNQQRAKVYYITGAQLKDSLEWEVARFYQTPTTTSFAEWDSETKALVDQGMTPILAPEYQKGWKGFTVYDGIEYVVNPTVEPRYDAEGNLIRDTHRIVSLTRNGVPVSDSDIFILVSQNISTSTNPVFGKYASDQLLVSKTAHISSMLETYMEEQTINGTLQMASDGNWKAVFPEGSNYLIKSAAAASEIAKTKGWYQSETPGVDNYSYYKAALGTADQLADKSGPFVVASPTETQVTGDPVKIRVEADDISGISTVSYLAGVYRADDNAWNNATSIADGSFKATQNGTYSVKATDALGNSNVTYVTVNNLDSTVATTPHLDKLTNRTKTLTGKASPGAAFHISVSGENYEATVGEDGKFSIKINAPKAGDTAEFYATDIQGRNSRVEQQVVKRTGANTPEVNNLTNVSDGITGNYDDDSLCSIVAVSGNTAYVPKNKKSIFKTSELADDYTIKSCDYVINGDQFVLKTPVPTAKQKFTVYGMDWVGRLSTKTTVKAAEVAPNQPRLMKVIAEEGMIYGRVPSPDSESYQITATTSDGKTYSATAASDGHFGITADIMEKGTQVSVTAADVKDGETRTSAARTISAESVADLTEQNSGGTEIEPVTDEDTDINATVLNGTPTTEVRLLYGGSRNDITLEEDGTFSFTMLAPLPAGNDISVVVRNDDHSLGFVDRITVEEAAPETPTITNEKITEDTTKITVIGNRDCTAVLKSGKILVQEQSADVTDDGNYVYEFTFTKGMRKKDRYFKVYLTNSGGDSDSVGFTVQAGKKKPAKKTTGTAKKKVDTSKKK